MVKQLYLQDDSRNTFARRFKKYICKMIQQIHLQNGSTNTFANDSRNRFAK